MTLVRKPGPAGGLDMQEGPGGRSLEAWEGAGGCLGGFTLPGPQFDMVPGQRPVPGGSSAHVYGQVLSPVWGLGFGV